MGLDLLVYHKIIKSGWIVLEKSLDNPAGTESNAFDADSNILFLCTFAYFTHMLTEYRLYSIPVTAIAIDVFRQDGNIIHARPQGCSFLP